MLTASTFFRPESALASLRGRLLPIDGTLGRLRFLADTLGVLELYRDLFPAEFRHHRRFSWHDTAALGRVCEQFYILVDTQLFPCTPPWDFEFDEAAREGIEPRIYTYCPWPGWWEQLGDGTAVLEEFPLADLAILVALGRVARTPDGYAEVEWSQIQGLPNDWRGRLAEASARKRGALRRTAEAVRFLLKDSGNFWVDVTEEELGYASDWPSWDRGMVQRFTEEWQAARRMAARCEELRAWVGTDPGRAAQVENLIRSALHGPGRARARVGGTPLVEILEDYGSEPEWSEWEEEA